MNTVFSRHLCFGGYNYNATSDRYILILHRQ